MSFYVGSSTPQRNMGTYAAGTTYFSNDLVQYNGGTYIALSTTTGNLPTNATYWKVFAAAGAPAGGTTGQVLTKNSATDYDSAWTTPATPSGVVPTGGTSGQVLTKNSATNYDAGWTTVASAGPTYTIVNLGTTGTYTPSAGQFVLCNTTAAAGQISVSLPTNPATGARVGVQRTDTTTANPVFIYSASKAVDGVAAGVFSHRVSYPGQSYEFIYDGTQWRSIGTLTVAASADLTTAPIRPQVPGAWNNNSITPYSGSAIAVLANNSYFYPIYIPQSGPLGIGFAYRISTGASSSIYATLYTMNPTNGQPDRPLHDLSYQNTSSSNTWYTHPFTSYIAQGWYYFTMGVTGSGPYLDAWAPNSAPVIPMVSLPTAAYQTSPGYKASGYSGNQWFAGSSLSLQVLTSSDQAPCIWWR
jgi:hypothetical protein